MQKRILWLILSAMLLSLTCHSQTLPEIPRVSCPEGECFWEQGCRDLQICCKPCEEERPEGQQNSGPEKGREPVEENILLQLHQNSAQQATERDANADAINGLGRSMISAENERREREIQKEKEELARSGKQTVACTECNGEGRMECITCFGEGRKQCSYCTGAGENTCTSCAGTGYTNIAGKKLTCMNPYCAGRGRIKCMQCFGTGFSDCLKCSSRGYNKCYTCSGTGRIVVDDRTEQKAAHGVGRPEGGNTSGSKTDKTADDGMAAEMHYYKDGLRDYENGNYGDAVKNFTKFLEARPKWSSAMYHRARSYFRLDRFEEAIGDLTNFIHTQGYYGDTHTLRAEARMRMKDYDGAIDDWTVEIENNREVQWFSYRQRGHVQLLKRNYERAVSDYTQSIELGPLNNEESYIGRGKAYFGLGKYDECIANMKYALSTLNNLTYPSALAGRGEAYLYRGIANIKVGRDGCWELKQAEKLGNASARIARGMHCGPRIDTERASKYFESGNSKLKTGDYQGAIVEYSNYLGIDPYSASTYFNRALARRSMGDSQGAISDCTKSIQIDSSIAKVYERRGTWKWETNDMQGAIADYRSAIVVDPRHAWAYNNLAYALALAGNYEEALDNANRAVEVDPNDRSVWGTRGRVYYGLGQYEKCILDMDKSLSIQENEYAYYWRGLARIKLDDVSNGCGDLEKAKSLGSTDAEQAIEQYCNK